jgi:hypothetical protein
MFEEARRTEIVDRQTSDMGSPSTPNRSPGFIARAEGDHIKMKPQFKVAPRYLRSIIMSVLAVAGVSMAISSTASAFSYHIPGPCVQKTPKQVERYLTQENCERQVGSKREGTWEFKEAIGKVKGTSGISRLESKLAGKAITIRCGKDKFSGTLEESGASKATIEYEECSLEGASGCVVPPITAKVLDRLVESEKATADEFFEKEGEGFATVVVEVCALKSSSKVTGAQICALPKGTELAVKHKIECATSGSKLKLGKEEAKYSGIAEVEFEEGKEWDVEGP